MASDNSDFFQYPSIHGRKDWMKLEVIWSTNPLPFYQTGQNLAWIDQMDEDRRTAGFCLWPLTHKSQIEKRGGEREKERVGVFRKCDTKNEWISAIFIGSISQQINLRNSWLHGISSFVYSVIQHIYWMTALGQVLLWVAFVEVQHKLYFNSSSFNCCFLSSSGM